MLFTVSLSISLVNGYFKLSLQGVVSEIFNFLSNSYTPFGFEGLLILQYDFPFSS